MKSVLKNLRLSKNLTQDELAKKLNIPTPTYKNYENGYSEIPYKVLILLADFFKISTDVLIGRVSNNIDFSQLNPSHFELIEKIVPLTPNECEKVASYIDGMKNK